MAVDAAELDDATTNDGVLVVAVVAAKLDGVVVADDEELAASLPLPPQVGGTQRLCNPNLKLK